MNPQPQIVTGPCAAVRTATLQFVETMPFHRFAYPGYQPTLWQADDRGPVCAVGAWVGDEPAGLAMSVRAEEDGLARVCSIYVAERFRRLGIGTELLSRLQESQHQRGIARLELGFRNGSITAAAVIRMLDRLGWPPAEPERLLCASDRRILEADWMLADYKLPPGYDIVPWADVTLRQRAALMAGQLLNPWVPVSLNPFKYESTMEYNSVAMRCGGEVVGFILTQRFDPSTLIYSCNYTRPDLQRRGRMVPLLVEAIRRQSERLDVPNAWWAVPYKHLPMVRFARRWMAPYATTIEDYCVSTKPIVPPAGAAE